LLTCGTTFLNVVAKRSSFSAQLGSKSNVIIEAVSPFTLVLCNAITNKNYPFWISLELSLQAFPSSFVFIVMWNRIMRKFCAFFCPKFTISNRFSRHLRGLSPEWTGHTKITVSAVDCRTETELGISTN
jgi:hypothetical protein